VRAVLDQLDQVPRWVWIVVVLAGVAGAVALFLLGRTEEAVADALVTAEAARRARRGKRQRDRQERREVDAANDRARDLEDRVAEDVADVGDLDELGDAEARRRLEALADRSNRRRSR